MDDTAWEAVFWDVGGVLLDLESVQRAHARFVTDLADEHGLDPDAAITQWREAVGEHFRAREGTAFRAARAAYAVGVEAIVGEPVPESEWRPDFRAVVAETVAPVPGAVEAIETLADRDRHLGVISDVDDDEGRWLLEHLGIRSAFDSITTSEAVGRTKPDPAMFETALETAGVSPERSLHVGDRYEHDMEGAKQLDMTTVALGASDGPAVDYRVESPLEVVDLVEGTTPGTA